MAMVSAGDRERRRGDAAQPGRAGAQQRRPGGHRASPSRRSSAEAVTPETWPPQLTRMMEAVVEQRHRQPGADRRGQGGRQDRHRPAGRGPAAARLVHLRSRRPTTRRSRWPSSSRTAAGSATRRPAARLAAPIAQGRDGGGARTDDHQLRAAARRALRAAGPDRRRRDGRGLARRWTRCSTARSRSRCCARAGSGPAFLARFRAEARTAAALSPRRHRRRLRLRRGARTPPTW